MNDDLSWKLNVLKEIKGSKGLNSTEFWEACQQLCQEYHLDTRIVLNMLPQANGFASGSSADGLFGKRPQSDEP